MHLLRFAIVLCILGGVASPYGKAQSLYLAPSMAEAERIRQLLPFAASAAPMLTVRTFWHGDTNVLALARVSDHSLPKMDFSGGRAYFSGFQGKEVAIVYGVWRLSYLSAAADLYQGNHDAAQVYLDSKSGSLNLRGSMQPSLTMNRTDSARFRVGYSLPVRLNASPGILTLYTNYVLLNRVQQGRLYGVTSGNQLTGSMTLRSTLGLPASETQSSGFSFDMALALQLHPKWRLSMTLENLFSQVWLRKLRQIDAAIAVNKIEPDADGFLHGVPLLQGQFNDHSEQADLHRRFDLGVAYHERRRDWMLFVVNDMDWRIAVGVQWDIGRQKRLWVLGCPDPFEMQAGYEIGNLGIQIGMSRIDPLRTRQATVNLTWRIPLGRR